ncbi:MAG: DMT family transporter [Gemmatimonadetes bacterium]|nr:DMT family transporter [Gemmatimonadota bacterium]
MPPIPSVLLAALSVVTGAAFAKRLFPELGAAGTAGVRIGLSALMLATVFRPPLRRLSAAQWRAVVPYGLGLGGMNLIFYLAIARIPLGLAVTIEFIGPLGLAVLGSRRLLDLVWVALAASGIALIAPWGLSGPSALAIDPVGVLLALAAGALWATYIVLGGRLARVLPGGPGVAAGMIVAAALVVPTAAGTGQLGRLTPRLLGAGAGVALLSSAIPYTLEMNALRALPARTFGILMSLEPAIAAVSGLLFLGERLTGRQWLATALVIAASTGVTWTARRVSPPVEV